MNYCEEADLAERAELSAQDRCNRRHQRDLMAHPDCRDLDHPGCQDCEFEDDEVMP